MTLSDVTWCLLFVQLYRTRNVLTVEVLRQLEGGGIRRPDAITHRCIARDLSPATVQLHNSPYEVTVSVERFAVSAATTMRK